VIEAAFGARQADDRQRGLVGPFVWRGGANVACGVAPRQRGALGRWRRHNKLRGCSPPIADECIPDFTDAAQSRMFLVGDNYFC
jgi:hypothetical protein